MTPEELAIAQYNYGKQIIFEKYDEQGIACIRGFEGILKCGREMRIDNYLSRGMNDAILEIRRGEYK